MILGYTFKENCKIHQIIKGLVNLKMEVSTYDPYLEGSTYTNILKNPLESTEKYDAIIIAVAHNLFKSYTTTNFKQISLGKLVLLDIKGLYDNSTWKL